MKRADIFRRVVQNTDEFGLNCRESLLYFLFRHFKRGKLYFVKCFAIFEERAVAVFSDVFNDIRDNALHVHGRHHARKDLVSRYLR